MNHEETSDERLRREYQEDLDTYRPEGVVVWVWIVILIIVLGIVLGIVFA